MINRGELNFSKYAMPFYATFIINISLPAQ